MSVWLTSGNAASSSRTRSASVLSTTRSVSPETTTSTTWLRAITSRTIGFSVSIGNVVIASTSFWTSSTTRRASAPNASSAITDARPSEAVDRIRRMPSMP